MVEVENQSENNPKYNFVPWDISTTGRLLCDDFFHMSCFFTNSKYEVYVMPYRNLSPFTSTRYNLVVSHEGMYRYLRRTDTGKVLKTKTEYFALQDFLGWLKSVNKNNRPIILTTFEHHQFANFILIQALKRYDLLDQFKELVYGFAHAFAFIQKKCRRSMPSMGLRTLARVLLDKTVSRPHDSFIRAKLLNEILFHLCNSENPEEVMCTLGTEMQPFIKTIDQIEQDLVEMKDTVTRMATLKPIFMPYFKGKQTRKKALSIRKQLIDANFDYHTLLSMWKEKGRDLFKTSMNESLKHLDDKSREDVISMLVLYFESLEMKNGRKKSTAPQEETQPKAEGSQPKIEEENVEDGSQSKTEESQSKKAEGPQPKVDGTLPNADATQPKANSSEPKADDTKPKAVGKEPNKDDTQPKADGTDSKEEGPKPKPEIVKPKAQGSSDGNDVPSKN